MSTPIPGSSNDPPLASYVPPPSRQPAPAARPYVAADTDIHLIGRIVIVVAVLLATWLVCTIVTTLIEYTAQKL